jgi:hypothetical protein
VRASRLGALPVGAQAKLGAEPVDIVAESIVDLAKALDLPLALKTFSPPETTPQTSSPLLVSK